MEMHRTIPAAVEKVATSCVDAAIHVHRALGPGFKEVIYHRAFCLELKSRNLAFESEKKIVVRYKEWTIAGQKVDLLVEGVVIVEIKAVPRIRKVHQAQLVSYLKTMDLRLGLILNFSHRWMKDGMKRVVV